MRVPKIGDVVRMTGRVHSVRDGGVLYVETAGGGSGWIVRPGECEPVIDLLPVSQWDELVRLRETVAEVRRALECES